MEKIEISKIRNIPHIEGNFSTHISLKIVNRSKKISMLINKIKSVLEQQDDNKNKIVYEECKGADLHLSLSKNIYLKYHQIEKFISRLKKEFQNSNKKISLILLSRVKYFNNEYSNRNFLTLEFMKNATSVLKKVMNSINEVLSEFGFSNFINVNKII